MAQSQDRKPPRFPYVAALLCVACVGAAGYFWMRYSYAWELTPGDLDEARLPEAYRNGDWPYGRRYVSVTGVLHIQRNVVRRGDDPFESGVLRLANGQEMTVSLNKAAGIDGDMEGSIHGRLSMGVVGDLKEHTRVTGYSPLFEVGYGRLTGTSIAGLMVGAMGVFAFGMAFRDWRRERT